MAECVEFLFAPFSQFWVFSGFNNDSEIMVPDSEHLLMGGIYQGKYLQFRFGFVGR